MLRFLRSLSRKYSGSLGRNDDLNLFNQKRGESLAFFIQTKHTFNKIVMFDINSVIDDSIQ